MCQKYGLISLFLQHKPLLPFKHMIKIIAVVKGKSEFTQQDGRGRRRQILCDKHGNDGVSK